MSPESAFAIPQPEVAPEAERMSLIQKLGDLATRTVIHAEIKAGQAIDAVSTAIATAKDHVKLEAGKIVAHASLVTLALGAGISGALVPKEEAHAAGKLEYTVTSTASGGVYARRSPHTNDTPRKVGYGVYPNETVEELCGITDGDPVGPYNNRVWHYVKDLSNPGEGTFWLNDHYIDNGISANHLTTGEPKCSDESSHPQAVTPPNPTTSSTHPLPCTPFLLIGARGSYEPYKKDGGNTTGFGGTLAPVADSLIAYYGKGNVTAYGLPYPAVEINPDNVLIHPTHYTDSVDTGETLLFDIVAKQVYGCPDQIIELMGYSQGADVVNYGLTNLSAYERAHIGSVVTFGDPHFNSHNSEDRGSYTKGHDGLLGTREEVPDDMLKKTRSYCDSDDLICNPGIRSVATASSSHFHYGEGDALDAAMFLESLHQKDTAPYA